MTKKKKNTRPTALSLAMKISEQVELEDIKLLKSRFSQLPDTTQGEKFFDVDRTVHVEVNSDENMITVLPKFELKGYSDKEKAEQNKPFLNIKAVFSLVYKAKDLSNLSKKAFDIFGEMKALLTEGKYVDDPLETYGGYGVVEIPNLQELLKSVCIGGFAHHVAATLNEVGNVVYEALFKYLGYNINYHNQSI